MRLLPSLALVLAILAAGCGGDGSGSAAGTEAAATVVPASAAGYISINTDLDSEQWELVKELSRKFPGRDQLLQAITSELANEDVALERDLEPALGPELAVVFLEGQDEPVGLTQPDDDEKLAELLAKGDEPTVSRKIDGWTAFASGESQLDAFARAAEGAKLADDETFEEATGELPDEAVVKAYGAGEALTEAFEAAGGGSGDALAGGGTLISVSAALEALDNGMKLSGFARAEDARGGEPYEPTLLERIPGDALAVASFNDLASGIEQIRSDDAVQRFLPEVERALGVTLDELGAVFGGEGALYVRAGSPIPEVTLVTIADDEERALATLRRLAQRATALGATTGTAELEGVDTTYVELQGVRVSFGAADGRVVVTSGRTAFRDLGAEGDKIVETDGFEQASEAVGLGDETSGFLYVDLEELIPLVEGFAGIAGADLPSEVSRNLEPLDTLLTTTSREGDEFRFTGFLGLR